MNFKIQSIHFDADQKLVTFIENKLSKVTKIFDNIVDIEVFLKLIKNQSPENKQVDIKIDIPGNGLYASKCSKTFEEATDLCIDALKIQLSKYKEKIRSK